MKPKENKKQILINCKRSAFVSSGKISCFMHMNWKFARNALARAHIHAGSICTVLKCSR